ncbi:protein starmaker-like [Saccostrea echinata]|uniref:protein starmaker-like n=1 Tax=Saccostrea echinata TaxID=191078 RepID=UPI002A828012|nr:protein starmaker-like [Saccostrea echinata]
MLPKVCKLCIIFLFQILVASASKWDLKMSLRDLISGHCHVVTPRVCRKYTGFDSDFTCAFILRHVCTNAYTGKQSLKMLADTDGNVHITPLPRSLSFYDVNEDGLISLNEFARTLGHNPRDLHVKVAFRAADKNGDGVVSFREFRTTDAWVFEVRHLTSNHHPRAEKVKVKRQRKVHQKDAIVKAYVDSDESDDVSEERQDSFEHPESKEVEHRDSFENSKETEENDSREINDDYEDDHYEHSDEIYDETDDSLERVNDDAHRGHIPHIHVVPISEKFDHSSETDKDSRESDNISHELYDSNEMNKNLILEINHASEDSEDNSHEYMSSEDNSHEYASEEVEDDSHEYASEEFEDDSHEYASEKVEDDSHEYSSEVEDNSYGHASDEDNSHEYVSSEVDDSHEIEQDNSHGSVSHEIEDNSHEEQVSRENEHEEHKDSLEHGDHEYESSHDKDDHSFSSEHYEIHRESKEDSHEKEDSREIENDESNEENKDDSDEKNSFVPK